MKRLLESSCCRRSGQSLFLSLLLLAILLSFLPASNAQDAKSTKRGICFLDGHHSDNALILSSNSPISWYYNWSPNPSAPPIPLDGPLEFTPLIHGLSDASSSEVLSVINSLPASSTHLLTFNEPDGSTDSGGSDISPEDAAQSYIDNIVPLRTSSDRQWHISQPSVTGSGRGLDWLRRFNESCYTIDAEQGCPADFIAAHWYGDFGGLASWLGTLDQYYNANRSADQRLGIWITEMGLPQASAEATVLMMNQSLPYLENLTYVEKYAWFGAFRSDDANEWTGDGVALFDHNGGLTQLGSLYMGGRQNGFAVGDQGPGAENDATRTGIANSKTCTWTLMFVALLLNI